MRIRIRIRIQNPASIDQEIKVPFRTLRSPLISGSKLCQLAFAGFFSFVLGEGVLFSNKGSDITDDGSLFLAVFYPT